MTALGQVQPRDAATSVAYTDYAQLGGRLRADGDEGIRQAARQFESLFLDMLLQQMRSAGEVLAGDSPFSSDNVRFHQQMLDHQLAIDLTESGGIGLAETIARQLGAEPQSSILKVGDAATAQPLDSSNAAPARPLDAPRGAAPTPSAAAPGPAVPAAVALAAAAPAPGVGTARLAGPNLPPLDDRDLFDNTLALAQQPPAGIDEPETAVEAFVDQLLPVVRRVAGGAGLHPLALLAQAALETGWGQKVLQAADGSSSHNLFNIKAHRDWDGPVVETRTREFLHGRMVEQQAAFRRYPSVEAAVQDYVQFVADSPRYRDALEAADDPAAYLDALHRGGYATDPAYVDKVLRVLDSPALRERAGEDLP